MSSNRLPGKSLMKISGYPLVVLSALRASNTGHRVIVLTSEDDSDDSLFDEVTSYGIECFRGNLNNVLLRFKEAVDFYKFDKNNIIIRLTADNIIPDGVFIQGLIDLFINNSNINYIGANYPDDNLPYGLNAEIFRVNSLLEAFNNSTSDFDLEHVTPWIKRNMKSVGISTQIPINYKQNISSKLNLTIDTQVDFDLMQKVFTEVNKPLEEYWYNICQIAHQNIKVK